MKTNSKDWLLVAILCLTIIITRTIAHLAPNLEFVTAAAITGGALISRSHLKIFPLILGLLISDLIIGNSVIFLFTWSAFFVVPFLGHVYQKLFKDKGLLKRLLALEATAVVATLIFFFWTNFGVVVVTQMYEKSLGGLLASYINALPFLKIQLTGNLLITPFLFLLILLVKEMRFNYSAVAEKQHS